MKVINLTNVCGDAIKNLERLHYEAMTKERIMGMALATMGKNNSTAMESFYEDYYKSFVEYEKEKQNFYNTYVAEHAKGMSSRATWEINFTTGDLSLYD